MKNKAYDYLIVGAGLYGATFAHIARQRDKKCLVIDRRANVGGNVYCECVEGINVHKYGAHIFHTNNKEVWNFVNGIVPFNRYTNSPIARYKDKMFNLPFNMNTFHEMWADVYTPQDAQRRIEEQKQDALAKIKGEGRTEAANLEEQAQLLIGKDIYEALIKGYTEKQWGRRCSDLPPFIIKRLPVRMVFDNNYFNALYQGIPCGGYNKLINGLLDGVEVCTGIDYNRDRMALDALADKVVYTGALDELFDYQLGNLQYRSLKFETEIVDCANYQGNAVINYTEAEVPYTRIIEHKHFEMFGADVYDCHKTVITREYPTEWQPGMEPYYPINDEQNNNLYAEYLAMAKQRQDMILGGRMAEYKYYDMDKTIEVVLQILNNIQ